MFFIFAYKDPQCSCCSWEYIFESNETLEEAQECAANLDVKGFSTTLIEGKKLSIPPEIILKAHGRVEEEKKALVEAERQEDIAIERRQYEDLKKKFGD